GKVVLKPTGGDLHFDVDFTDLSRGGLASRKLALILDTSLEDDAVSGSIKANGDLANQRLTLDRRFPPKAHASLPVPLVSGGWASAAVDFKDLAITPTGATGSGHLRMAHLQDLAPLVGVDLAGGIDLQVATEPDGAGKVKIDLRGHGLRSGATGAGDLK